MNKSIALSLIVAATLGLAACKKSEEANTATNNAVENASLAADNAMDAAGNLTNAANVSNTSNAM